MQLVEFTRKSYIEVFRQAAGGPVHISRHLQFTEANESALNHAAAHGPGVYEIIGERYEMKVIGVLAPADPAVDTDPPTEPTTVIATSTGTTTTSVTWGLSTDNVGVTGYQVFRNGTPIGTTSGPPFADSGLSANTQYNYQVQAFDAAGNVSTLAGPASVTTDQVSNDPPVWSITDQSLPLNSAYAIDLNQFCVDPDGDEVGFSLVSGTLPTGVSLDTGTGVISGTPTQVEVQATTLGADDGINPTANAAVTWTVTNTDMVAPDAPANVQIQDAFQDRIALSWDANTEPDFSYYTLYRSTDGISYGVRATNITVTSWTDTGLNVDQQYFYKLTATDSSGNESADSTVRSEFTRLTFTMDISNLDGYLANDTGITNPACYSRIISVVSLDGVWTFGENGYAQYVRGSQTGTASFVYQLWNYDGNLNHSTATAVATVDPL